MKLICNSRFVFTVVFLLAMPVSFVAAQVMITPEDQETITVLKPDGNKISVIVPRRAIDATQLAVLANLQDVQSVNTAQYYAQVRHIPVENIIYLSFVPNRASIRAAEFKLLKQQVDTAVAKLSDIQAYVITWTDPWVVYEDNLKRGMSITSAFSLGFDSQYYNNTPSVCALTSPVATFNADSYRPYHDFNVRPAMMLGGVDFTNVKALIDRGKLADGTFPTGTGYLMRTTDRIRSLRYSNFIQTADFWNRPDGIGMTYLDNSSGKGSNYIMNKPDVLMYFTGLTTVPQLSSNSYVPGAVGDHLTSYGGMLTGTNSQMSILRFLEAGLTGSYGTVEEPCAYASKFPNTFIFTRHYFMGNTLLEAYWKSVQWLGEGIFVGDPLARPYGTKVQVDSAGKLNITTTILKPKHIYSLLSANSVNGPFKTIQAGLTIGDQPGTRIIQVPAVDKFYVLKEEFDSSLPLSLPLASSNISHPVTNGQQVAWYGWESWDSVKIFIYDPLTKKTTSLPYTIGGQRYPLMFVDTKIILRERKVVGSMVKNVIQVIDSLTQERKVIAEVDIFSNYNEVVDQGRYFWIHPAGLDMLDLVTGEIKNILPGVVVASFAVNGDRLAYVEADKPDFGIVIKNISTMAIERIIPGQGFPRYTVQLTSSTADWVEPYINADFTKAQILSYDFSTGKISSLAKLAKMIYFGVSENWVVWGATEDGQTKASFSVYNRTLKTIEKIKFAVNDEISGSVSLHNVNRPRFGLSQDRLVWINQSNSELRTEIYTKFLTNGSAGYWKLDEAAGTVAQDSSGNNNTAILMNGPVWTSGKVKGALSFDGVDDYLRIENSESLEVGKNGADWTIAFWIKVDRVNVRSIQNIISKGESMSGKPALWLSFNTLRSRLLYCARTTASTNTCGYSSESIPYETWVHVAYIKSASNLQLFINGNLSSSKNLTGMWIPNSEPFYFGKKPLSSGFKGALDDIQIYHRALTSSEIQTLARVNGGVAPYITVQPANQIATINKSAIFRVGAGGTGSLIYEWKKNGTVVQKDSSPNYIIPQVKLDDIRAKFSVTISNSAGQVQSRDAYFIIKTVSPPRVPPPVVKPVIIKSP